jgi:uncharacterized damage-inducible protein DinB
MKAHWQMFAGYNAWANERIYEKAAELGDQDYRADRGAFFKSVHGTLDHLLVADRIWMRRFAGEGEEPTRLDAILYESFADLRAARSVEDARIAAFVDGLNEARLASTFHYRAISKPADLEQELAPALAHFSTTRHIIVASSIVYCLLTGLVGAAPELDLVAYQRLYGLGGTSRVT